MGKIFGDMTRTGVEGLPGATPKYFDNPGEAAISAARGTKAPTTVTDANGIASFSGAVNPVMHKPSFAEANSGGFTSPGLTTKGKVLGALLAAGQGAALGAGQPSFGAGFERASIFPMQQKRMQQNIEQEDLAAQAQRQAIEQAPVLFKSRLDSAAAQADADKARAGLYRDRENAPNTVVVGGRLVNKETGEPIMAAPEPRPLFKGNPAMGITQVNPDGTTKDIRQPNPKPKPQAKAPKPQKPSVRQFTVQGRAYAIPEAEVDAFLLDHPEAVRAKGQR